jgi:hypothetical protein
MSSRLEKLRTPAHSGLRTSAWWADSSTTRMLGAVMIVKPRRMRSSTERNEPSESTKSAFRRIT